MVQAICEAHHTSQWKTTWIDEHVHPSYGHQNSIHQHFNFTHLLPYCKYLYLSERLINSLLKQVKQITCNLIIFYSISFTDASQ